MLNNSLPLYKQIANKLKNDILNSGLEHGDAIPPESKLVKMYEVSRVTIRQALKILIDEGLLYSVQGSGTYISHDKIQHNIFRLQGFTEEMGALDNTPSNEIIEFKLMLPPSDVKEILTLSEDKQVYYIKRLRLADKEPLILEESYLPVELFPDLSVEVMKKSKYDYIEKKGHVIDKRYGELVPILPNEELKQIFNLNEHQPLLFLKAFATFQDGLTFEYSNVYYHPNKYAFKFISTKG
ncbi:GntR family transcriptional regulator [Amphibacillus sediminis]|uniref:GntR family transcriptional regulator n=1 Tax=Amphibacillus sediminis TaxID=360185 RepID=UPI00082DA76D|nr:GntR family transcriptional regulator [Amphibacillus sediminis]